MTNGNTKDAVKEIHNKAVEICNNFKGVSVVVNRQLGMVTFSVETSSDKEAMWAAKKELADFVMRNFENRKWVHSKVDGYKTWNKYSGSFVTGFSCGITPVLTEEETNFVLLGGRNF